MQRIIGSNFKKLFYLKRWFFKKPPDHVKSAIPLAHFPFEECVPALIPEGEMDALVIQELLAIVEEMQIPIPDPFGWTSKYYDVGDYVGTPAGMRHLTQVIARELQRRRRVMGALGEAAPPAGDLERLLARFTVVCSSFIRNRSSKE